MSRPLPLADVRVVAVEQYGAGPFGSVHLADLGAEIIKIEDPNTGGDVGRHVPPYAVDGDSLFFETFNRNKRSLALDIANPVGRGVFEDLVRVSDAVYSNLRGDVPAKLKIQYADLADVNPKVVCCSLSGFGMTGPRATEPGYDYILQGLTGWMSLTGEPDGPPAKSGLSLVDFTGGMVAAFALVCGVHSARRDNKGLDCDVSLFDTAMTMLSYPATWYLNEGWEPQRMARSSHPSLVPFGNFPTTDGWVIVGCAKQKFFERLCSALRREDLAADPRFKTFETRLEHREAITAELDAILSTESTAHWLSVLGEAGVPCGPVNSVADALADPHTAARGMVVETEHPRFGTVKAPASPVKVGVARDENRRAPTLNEDSSYVLGDLLKYSDQQIAELRSKGAFG